MKYKLKVKDGTHRIDEDTKKVKGETFVADYPLQTLFPDKFELVAELSSKAKFTTTEKAPNNAEGDEDTEDNEDDDEEEEDDSESNGVEGEDVTDEFSEAAENDIKVYQVSARRFRAVSDDGEFDSGELTRAKLIKAVSEYLDS